MKIAMILPSLANKGPILVARDLCIEYKKMGHECSVFYFDDIVEVELPCPSKRISFWRPIDWNAFDIVHSHMYRSDAYVFFHKPILRKCRTKFITTLHQHIAEQMPFDFPAAKASFVIHTWLLFLRRLLSASIIRHTIRNVACAMSRLFTMDVTLIAILI